VKRLERTGLADCMGYGKWAWDGTGFPWIGCSVVSSLSLFSPRFSYSNFNLSFLCIALAIVIAVIAFNAVMEQNQYFGIVRMNNPARDEM